MPRPRTRNADLLRLVAERIRTQPEKYSQEDWGYSENGCLTSGCIAGHAAAAAGWIGSRCSESGRRWWTLLKRPQGTKEFKVSAVAEQALGLSKAEAKILFHADWRAVGTRSNSSFVVLAKRAADALDALAAGATIEEVTAPPVYRDITDRLASGHDDWYTDV